MQSNAPIDQTNKEDISRINYTIVPLSNISNDLEKENLRVCSIFLKRKITGWWVGLIGLFA